MLKTKPMREILLDLMSVLDPDLNNRFELAYDGHVMYSRDLVLSLMEYNWSSWDFVVSSVFQASTAYFAAVWSDYKAETIEQLYRAWTALQAEYDPISNYDMTETAADGKRLDKSTDTTTPSGGTKTETRTYRAGLNSVDDGVQADYIDNQTTPLDDTQTETVTDHDNTQSMTFDGSTMTGYHEANEHYLKRSGNIGVTTAAQMIEGELDVRARSLVYEYLQRFFDRYAFSVGGDD